MKKNIIKKLADSSFTKEKINEDTVMKIAKVLKREDLKFYIKNLKMIDSKKTVHITIPNEEGMNEMKKYFLKLYPNKKIVFNFDPSLITGIKVVDYDTVYELSLKNLLEGAVRSTND